MIMKIFKRNPNAKDVQWLEKFYTRNKINQIGKRHKKTKTDVSSKLFADGL